MRVETVFLDYGGTLAYVDPDPIEIWLTLLRELGHRVNKDVLKRAHERATSAFTPKIYEYHGRIKTFWILFDKFVLETLGVADPDGELAEGIERGFAQDKWFHTYPETHEALETLRQRGYRLGIISNNVDDIKDRMATLDLTRYFDTITYSQEVGVAKPEAGIFRAALTRTQAAAATSVHVGDRYEDDVVGARRVGITPILLDRHGEHASADCLRIRVLRQLEATLDADL